MFQKGVVGFRVVAFGMNLKNGGCVHRHRGINVNRNFGNGSRILQKVKIVNQLLRAFDGKRRDDDFTARLNNAT